MLDSDRLRTALAVDAGLTVLAGLLVYARPSLLDRLLPDRRGFGWLGSATVARKLGLAVAVFGTVKGFLYAVALGRSGGAPSAEDEETN